MTSLDRETGDHRYRIGEILGRGGMATVYRGYDEAAQQEVALKVLHEHLVGDEGVVEAFEREAELMGELDHPGVVRVYTTTEIDGRPAIAMELCEGDDLAEVLTRTGPFDEDRALEMIDGVLDALSSVHDRDVLHRDVKPHNIMFDADGEPRLIDFGIGQAEELMAVDESGQVGTVEYMAPERADGLAVDARSDLYSAGIVLFELLCGHPPYRAESAPAVLRMHREGPVADPRAFGADVSDEVADAVMRALARHPEDRFDDVDVFRAALQGEVRPQKPIEEHPVWTALHRRYGEECRMAAPVDTSGHEWVVYVPRGGVEENEDAVDRVVAALVDDYGEYVTDAFRDVVDMAADDGDPQDVSGAGVRILDEAGVARGLSRDGVDEIVGRLEEAGVMARYGRRPRRHRDESAVQRLLGRRVVWKRSILVVSFIFHGFLFYVSYLAFTDGLEMVPEGLLVGLLASFAVASGSALAWMMLPDTYGEWWRARMSTSYLFDFCCDRRLDDSAVVIGHREYELLKSLQSPRIAASYERALNMVLYLHDYGIDHRRLTALVDGIDGLVEELRELESHLAAVHPGRLVSRIRQLDGRIEQGDDIEELDELMQQKGALRQRLTERDTAHQRLQGLSQRLHELAVRLESMVRRVRTEDTGRPPATDEELGVLVDDVEKMTVLDFSAGSMERDEESQEERQESVSPA